MNATMKITLVSAFAALSALVAACSGSSTDGPTTPGASNNPPTNQDPQNPGGGTGTTREALTFTEPCAASTCGEVPSSNPSAKPVCAQAAGSCSWTAPDPNGSVSWRECKESECGAAPGNVCPAGTEQGTSTCGSENEGPCKWQTACLPPKSTTPCATADGCGPQPAIGVICKDGSNGDLVCMQTGSTCNWQRSCD